MRLRPRSSSVHQLPRPHVGRPANKDADELKKDRRGEFIVPEQRRAAEPGGEGVENHAAFAAARGGGHLRGELADGEELEELGGLIPVGGDEGRLEGVEDARG